MVYRAKHIAIRILSRGESLGVFNVQLYVQSRSRELIYRGEKCLEY